MSSEPEYLDAPDSAIPLYVGYYTGPTAPDGHAFRMLQLSGHGGETALTVGQAHRLADWFIANGYGGAGRAHFAELDRFVCPKCFKVSNNPDDLKHGFCGRCHDWTGDDRR